MTARFSRSTPKVAGLLLAAVLATAGATAGEITIRIAPATLNLQSGGVVVTVHTDVPYGEIDVASVYLAGVAIDSWKADDRGYFVAKFLSDDVKTIDGLLLNQLNTLTFVALTIYNEPVWGAAEVMVIDRGGAASGGAGPTAAE
jgi:hypothetical protein